MWLLCIFLNIDKINQEKMQKIKIIYQGVPLKINVK